MNRRGFLRNILSSSGAFYLMPLDGRQTRHLVVIITGGARKKDYYETASLSPNIRRLAREGFVFEQDHCERVASHETAFAELLQGRALLDSIGNGIQLDSIHQIPRVMQQYKPRIVICRDTSHDVGHHSYARYLNAVRTTDAAIGEVFDWIKAHPDFSNDTAIVIRPEFGRDDEVNQLGQLHHSYGFYYTHRVASIFWGPDFNRGVDRTTVIKTVDMMPTLTRLFGIKAIHAEGSVVPGLFKTLSSD